MELTKKVTTQQIYNWNDEGLWSKEKGYNKNDEHKYHVVVLDFGCKKKYFKKFF